MVKAYMSVPGVRSILTDVCGCDAGSAVLEAYIITRETEPDNPLTVSLHVERLQGTARQDGRGRAGAYGGCLALAEALAAFCDDGQEARS